MEITNLVIVDGLLAKNKLITEQIIILLDIMGKSKPYLNGLNNIILNTMF